MSDADELVQIRRGPPRPLATAGPDDSMDFSRRQFMKLLGAGVVLAGLDGCDRRVPEKILPYSVQPPGVQPGLPAVYATSMLLDGFAVGLLVRSQEGRPTKVEGNPAHPASLGASGLYEQASVLQLYDPDRARRVRRDGEVSSWEVLFAELRRPRTDRGAGLRLLLEPTSSPTVHRLLARVRALYPACKITYWSPLPALANSLAGTQLAFGRPLQPHHHFDEADVIVALDADPLSAMPLSLRHARAWAERRRSGRNRLYAVECMMSPTGSAADHRLPRRSSEIVQLAASLAAALPGVSAELKAAAGALREPVREDDRKFTSALTSDLLSHQPGHTLVVVGERQPPVVHALGFAINAALGNLGRTLTTTAPVLPQDGDQDLLSLVGELSASKVDRLLILDGNPVYSAPVDYRFAQALAKVPESVYLGAYENETAAASVWVAPAAHYLESWGDGRAYDGTLSIVQPLIRPLHEGRTPAELLSVLAGDRAPDAPRLVKETHAERPGWDAALAAGLYENTALPVVEAQLSAPAALARALRERPSERPGLEVNFQASPTLHDGRFSNNPWLLEQPEPITKLTWGNAVLVGPSLAAKLGIASQDLVELRFLARLLRGPALIVPGHAADAVTVWLGYGRHGAESNAAGVGFNAYVARTSDAPAFQRGAQLVKVGGSEALALTQLEVDQHGRPIALSTTVDELRRDPGFTSELKGPLPSLHPEFKGRELQWAMSIDLSICTGCSACMLGCQSENNVPVVGKANVLRGHTMQWLRIDTYYHQNKRPSLLDNPRAVHQPMMCQHCEKAPCEYVCPVNATVHSPDGLNEMVYNRCVGTRFCQNNCPYKVRRFNWFNWHKEVVYNQGQNQLVYNPDVTVRDRGVMEKCTYCVQRIRETEIHAELQKRVIRPGEVVTACQQACPTGAIQFGALAHTDTPMVRWRAEPRSYEVLHDQNTRPRTHYLARVDNPNPELG